MPVKPLNLLRLKQTSGVAADTAMLICVCVHVRVRVRVRVCVCMHAHVCVYKVKFLCV